MPQSSQGGSITVTGSLLVQTELLIAQKRWRRELPDNDTYCLYVDLVTGDLPRDKPHTIAAMAQHSRQSIDRFYTSLRNLEEAGYVRREEIKRSNARPGLNIILKDLPLEVVPQMLAVPALPELPEPVEEKRGRGRPRKEPVEEPPFTVITTGWGEHPIKRLHTMLDELQHIDPKSVVPTIYTRESRDAKVICQAYDAEYVARRILDILREEKYIWRNKDGSFKQRLGATALLKKLPTGKGDKTYGNSAPPPVAAPQQAALSFFGGRVPSGEAKQK